MATIPGISERAAQVIISEIGIDMARFPTAAHLGAYSQGMFSKVAAMDRARSET